MTDPIREVLADLGVTADELDRLRARAYGCRKQANRRAENVRRRREIYVALHEREFDSWQIAEVFGVSGACVRTVIADWKRATGRPLTPGRYS
jgi:hypothetical protein